MMAARQQDNPRQGAHFLMGRTGGVRKGRRFASAEYRQKLSGAA
jgi:hypothetical protein